MKEKMKDKSVLITGGGGFLGSALLERSWHPDGKFYVQDLQFNEVSTRLAARKENVYLITADLTDPSALAASLHGLSFDLVFHFAALLDRNRDFGIFPRLHQVNVMGTYNLLKALQEVPYEGFFFASTSEVYGIRNQPPFRETQQPSPPSPYSLSKLMSEELIRSYSQRYGKPYTIGRIFNFFGPGMPVTTFLPELIQAWKEEKPFLMTKGGQKRDYLYIDELVYYILSLTGRVPDENLLVNICSGTSVSMKDLASHAVALSGGKLKVSYDLPYREVELWDNRGCVGELHSLVKPVKAVSPLDWMKTLQ